MPKTRHMADRLIGQRPQLCVDGVRDVPLCRLTVEARRDRIEQRHALLAGATMHVAQHVDGAGHGIVDPHAAGHRHAGGRDRGSLRAVINRSNQRGLEQPGRTRLRELAAGHQVNHLGKADAADQLLDRVATDSD